MFIREKNTALNGENSVHKDMFIVVKCTACMYD